jgi:AraC-like DNA-binding protein
MTKNTDTTQVLKPSEALQRVTASGYFVSANYANLVFHALGGGVDTRACFERHGISQELLENSTSKIEFEALYEAVFELLKTLELTDAGLSIGTKMHVSSHGTLGMAVISATTVGQAIRDAAKYYKTAIDFIDVDLFYEDDAVVIELVESFDNPEVSRIVAEAMMLTLQNALEFVSGQKLTCAKVIFGYQPPDYFEDYKNFFSGEVEFSGLRHMMILPKYVLDMHCITADENIHRLAEEQLLQKMQDIRDNNLTVQHVLNLMRRTPGDMPSLDDLAKMFNVSSRTMIRHFQAEGTNYRELRDRVHKDLATDSLRNTDNSVECIAMEIGYQDTASFRRAFKRWCGQSPSAYRAENRTENRTDTN